MIQCQRLITHKEHIVTDGEINTFRPLNCSQIFIISFQFKHVPLKMEAACTQIHTTLSPSFLFFNCVHDDVHVCTVMLLSSGRLGVHSNPTVISHTQLLLAQKKKPWWKWKPGRYLFTVWGNPTYTDVLSKCVSKCVWAFVCTRCNGGGQVYLTHSSF